MTRPLIQVAEVDLGRQRSPEHERGEHMVKYLRSANVGDGVLMLDDVKAMNFSPAEQQRFGLRCGDILVTEGSGSRGTVGQSAVWQQRMFGVVCFQNTLLRIRPRPGLAVGGYLAWWARHAHSSGLVAAVASGANILHVSAEALRRLPVPDLQHAKQARVADFLDDQVARIDRVMAVRRLQAELWEDSFLAMIAEVLVGSRTATKPRVRVAPWLGPMPSSWGFAPVSALYRVQLGKMLNPERASGPNLKPYLRNANVHWFDISIEDVAQMSFEPMELARYRLQPGDLMVCEGGAGVAEAGMWRGEIAECYYQKSLHRVRATGHLPAEWLMYWLRLAKSVGALESEGNLATIPHLTSEQFKEWRIPVPPSGYDGVNALERERANLDKARSLLRASVARLDELKQSLISAAVTGEFDVSTADGSQVPIP